jgi:hypothetical protein
MFLAPLSGEFVVQRYLILLALLGVSAARPEAPPAPWPLGRYVEWQTEWGSRTIEASGLKARVELKRCGIDRPASEACGAGTWYLAATVHAAGAMPVVVEGSPGLPALVGIGKLTSKATRPSLILISMSGGSGGCAQIDLAAWQGLVYRTARLNAGESGHGKLCGIDETTLAWPRDLTGHGHAEFLLQDTVFQCRFTSCAGSWFPPRVIAFDGYRGRDVSEDPALAPLYRADMAKARYACEHDTDEAQGACAGYAADAARLGKLPEAWGVIRAQVERGCRIPSTRACYDINRIPETFPAKLAAVLAKAGYR